MKLNVLNRRVHHWLALCALPPLAVTIGSGLLLQSKKHWSWVQPTEFVGTGTHPRIDLEGVLASARQVPWVNVSSWDDVNRVDLRPDRGIAKVWLRNGCEIQVDLGTGDVLHVADRRSDLIEAIHDGSFFGGDAVKLGLFLPAVQEP